MNILQVTSRSSRPLYQSRRSSSGVHKSQVRNSWVFSFANYSDENVSATNFTGDIDVLVKCTLLSVFHVSHTAITGKTIPAPFFHRTFPHKTKVDQSTEMLDRILHR
jgi:hypothetical protein